MKKIVTALVCLLSISAFSQNNFVDVIVDGKPAKMNTATGIYTFTDGAPSSYTANTLSTVSSNTGVDTVEEKTLVATEAGKVHIVAKGETLYSISKKYEISMAQIKSLNNLTTNILSIDQQLVIGYNTSAEIIKDAVYIVAKGDTLYSIAKEANITVQELKQLNNIESSIISIGQELKLK